MKMLLKSIFSSGMRFPTVWNFGNVESDEPVQPPFKHRNLK